MFKAVSPTITQVSSRSPTPSPTDYHEGPQDGLSRPPSATTVPSPLGEVAEVISPHGSPQDEEHAALLKRPPPVSSASAPAGKIPQINLQDLSLYTDSCAPAAALAPSSTSLPELTHLLRLQTYQEKRRSRIQMRLHRGLISVALFTRLKNCNELAFRSLVDSFRFDDKKGFASLYNAVQDVRRSCEATWRHAELDLDTRFGNTNQTSVETGPNSTFMHKLPAWIQEDLLNFVCLIRTDSDFLASRIASLSPPELASMTAFHQSLDTIDSVMPSQSRGRPLGYRSNRNSAFLPTPVERLLSFQRHDPLSALLHTVFASSEDLQRLEVWSTTCARVITEGKSGGEQFVCSVFNAWAAMQEWPFKSNLEMYLMEILQESAFLLDGANEQPSGPKGPTELRNAKDAIAQEEFFDMALKRLFDILDDEHCGAAIPPSVVKLGHAILRKLQKPKKQLAAETFIVSKWFFSTFLLNAIICPEVGHSSLSSPPYSLLTCNRAMASCSAIISARMLDRRY